MKPVCGLIAIVLISCTAGQLPGPESDVEFWLTTSDRSSLMERRPGLDFTFDTTPEAMAVIELDTSRRFQSIDGFGYALTGGSAYLIHRKLDSASRAAVLNELFLFDDANIGVSYLRVSIGASDLDDHVFSYVERKPENDVASLAGFTLDEDRKNLIPVLKEILRVAPGLKIMASPWSAPAWMKTNNHAKGGSLKPEYYPAYANYFVRYIAEMKKEGITIDAVTIQNEPENPNNTPSMVMTAAEQARFVKEHLGPAFRNAGLQTRIVIFDHNCDHPEYPIAILDDPDARRYVDGSAFHLYLGQIEAMSKVHDAYPDKNIYFTEQWTSGKGDFAGDLKWHVKNLIIGAPRNWSRNVLEWNLAADPEFGPHTDDGGCTICQGALTIGDSVKRNVSYYIIAHASKFVRPRSVRVASNMPEWLPNVAFVTPAGKKVAIVLNESENERAFVVTDGENRFQASLAAGAVATFVW